MNSAADRLLKFLAITVVLALGFTSYASAKAGPFSGPNGKLAAVKHTVGEDVFMGTISPNGHFDPLYEEWDYSLAGTRLSFSGDGSRIALSLGWRPSRLAIDRTSGGHPRYLETRNLDVSGPYWAKNGRIVFNGTSQNGKRNGTYSIRPDGKDMRKHFGRSMLAASPDLAKFVGASSPAFSHYLDLLDRNGKRVRLLARSKTHFFVDPVFSPDGRWVAYERYPPGKSEQAGERLSDIFIVRTDGTDRRRLTGAGRDRYPAFSPDSRWLAFVRRNRDYTGSFIAAMRLDRPEKIHRITDFKDTYFTELTWGRKP